MTEESTKFNTCNTSKTHFSSIFLHFSFKNISYNESADFQAISLPYCKDGLKMTVLLPKADLVSFEASLTASKLKQIFADMRNTREVKFQMPKFTIESELDLKEVFEKLGFGHVFTAASDDYSNLTNESVFLSMARHKAKIEVNEEGTVAAAATVAKIMARVIAPSFNKPKFSLRCASFQSNSCAIDRSCTSSEKKTKFFSPGVL